MSCLQGFSKILRLLLAAVSVNGFKYLIVRKTIVTSANICKIRIRQCVMNFRSLLNKSGSLFHWKSTKTRFRYV